MNLRKLHILTIAALSALALSACGSKYHSSTSTGEGGYYTYQDSTSTGEGGSYSYQSTNIARVACDATFENILQQEIDVYEYRTKLTYPVLPYYVSEKQCVDSLLAGKVQIAVIARPLTGSEEEWLRAYGRHPHTSEIAIDAIAIIANKDNPLEALTTAQLKDILTGKYTEWSQLGADQLGKISVIFDNPSSSTARCLRESLLDTEPFGTTVGAASDSLDSRRVFEMVAKNKNLLGVIGVSWTTRDLNSVNMDVAERTSYSENYKVEPDLNFREEIKVMKIGTTLDNAVRPWQAYIFDGSYPLHRPIYMINTGGNGTGAHSFYVFVTGWIGQKLIQETGILPKTMRTRVVTINN